MATGKILLVRHGQDTDNAAGILNGRRDTALTELGRQQAAAVAKLLVGSGVDAIVSSPLLRARETATIISDNLCKINTLVIDSLIERDFGIFTGMAISEITIRTTSILKTPKVNYFLNVEGAEAFSDLYIRALAALSDINDRFLGKTVIAVTHGDIGAMIRAAHHGYPSGEGRGGVRRLS